MNEKRVVRNIEIPGINGKKVICDVYGVKPINLELGLRPAVIFLHGGGFVAGDKDQFLGMAALLALEEDILCITVPACDRSNVPVTDHRLLQCV